MTGLRYCPGPASGRQAWAASTSERAKSVNSVRYRFPDFARNDISLPTRILLPLQTRIQVNGPLRNRHQLPLVCRDIRERLRILAVLEVVRLAEIHAGHHA